jgi:hypothetical protein
MAPLAGSRSQIAAYPGPPRPRRVVPFCFHPRCGAFDFIAAPRQLLDEIDSLRLTDASLIFGGSTPDWRHGKFKTPRSGAGGIKLSSTESN